MSNIRETVVIDNPSDKLLELVHHLKEAKETRREKLRNQESCMVNITV